MSALVDLRLVEISWTSVSWKEIRFITHGSFDSRGGVGISTRAEV